MDDSETPGTFPALKRSCSTLGPSAVPVKCGSTKTARRLFECLVDPYLPSAASRPEALHHIAINSQTQQLLRGLKLRTTLPAFSGQNCDQTGGQYRKRRFRQPEIFFAPHRIVSGCVGRFRVTVPFPPIGAPQAGSHSCHQNGV